MSAETSGIRVKRQRGFTVVYNDLLPKDGSLSARAWGLYVYLTGRPDGWETRVSHLQTVFREGRDAIYSALRELVEAGLMGKEDYIANGLKRTRYTLDVDAAGPREPRNPGPGNRPGTADSQDPGNPAPGNPGQVSKEGPSTDLATGDESLRSPSHAPLTEAEVETGRNPDGTLLPASKRKALAQVITRSWWDWVKASDHDLPTQSFVACMSIVKQALANEVPPRSIRSGLARLTTEGRPVTGASLQMALGVRQGGRNRHGAHRPANAEQSAQFARQFEEASQ